MRALLIFLVIAGLGAVFIVQKRSEHTDASPNAAPSQETTPRQPSEHDWAKRSLDTTNSVIHNIQQQRKDDDLRDAVGRRR
jgi:hypothetical protein